MWKRILKSRGIEIDSSDELDDFIMKMDLLLYAQQYANASEGFNSTKTPTIEEALAYIRETETTETTAKNVKTQGNYK